MPYSSRSHSLSAMLREGNVFNGRHRGPTLFGIAVGSVATPFFLAAYGVPITEALYVGFPCGIGLGFLGAAYWWAISHGRN